MEPSTTYKQMFRIAADALLSTRCCLCGKPLALIRHKSYPLCAACADQIQPVAQPRCIICSMPLVSEQRVCMRCRNHEYEFKCNYSLFVYSGLVKELIYQYKTKGMRNLSWLFAEHLAAVLKNQYPGLPIVPVPYRPKRKRTRGWDQVECITSILKRKYGVRTIKMLRRRNSVPQKYLNYEERKRNLTDKISLNRLNTAIPNTVMLIDDIFTTGATGNECARALKLAGVTNVYIATIALDR